MVRRRPNDGRGCLQQHKLLLAFVVFLIPWIQLADAQQQHQNSQQNQQQQQRGQAGDGPIGHSLTDVAAIRRRFATPLHDGPNDGAADGLNAEDGPKAEDRVLSLEAVLGQHESLGQAWRPPRPRSRSGPEGQRRSDGIKTNNKQIIVPDDASALATLAPVQAVRAPYPSRRHNARSLPTAGLSWPQNARSLEDWEVEDFVLLATIDGHLYASDRKTGQERWHLEVDEAMVETVHHRANSSVLDDDYSPVDHYIWAVEPNRDGGVYVWTPTPDSRPRATGFTMKRLVEELAPYAGQDPPVVYTGDKKTTMVTIDAATGRIIKWFGSTGSHVNQYESCLRPNALYDSKKTDECSRTGSITLGRTEYTVGIQRRDGLPIATLKYVEWSPNNYDNDLFGQYHVSLDSQYITSQHDGKVYAFDYACPGQDSPMFSHKFSAPVVRVFDVCRPWDAPSESNPDLVVLPQPTIPSLDESIARMRRNSVFLNQTETGSWYALSGHQYPLIVDAPLAQASFPGWWDAAVAWDSINEAKVTKALVGTHALDTLSGGGSQQPPTLPAGTIGAGKQDPENDSNVKTLPEDGPQEPTIMTKVKSLRQSAARSITDFIKNPILFFIFVFALVYNEEKLRRSYQRWRSRGNLQDGLLSLDFIHNSQEQARRPEDKEGQEDKMLGGEPGKDEDAKDTQQGASPFESAVEEKTKANEHVDKNGERCDAANNAQGHEAEAPTPNKKKAHRGRRGGVKHRKGRAKEAAQSTEEEGGATTVDEAVKNAQKLGEKPSLEPDVMTVTNDMQAVTGPVIRMGNIEVNTEVQLGTGSNGTVVFAGRFDGREVAVKRMLIQFCDIASQETRLLRESDDHPNVIRYYAQQSRQGFLYIALERCAASLADVVSRPHAFRELAEAGRRDLPGVLYQITNGISHLHSLRIVHRDLKPQNILVNMGKDGKPRLMVSDFGLCKKLEGGQSSFGATTGRAAGTSGWRAPELLLDDDARATGMVEASTHSGTHSGSGSLVVSDGGAAPHAPHSRRATRAIDIFSLGLVFFYVLTNGSHPFDCGDRYMREVNIRKSSFNLGPLDSLGDFAFEAKDLIGSMIDADARRRPTALAVMAHPFFWPAKKRLAFLCDVSDHFEKEVRDPPSPALVVLERNAPAVTRADFLKLLPRDFVDSLGKQRKYTGSRLLDLLRALRNKRNHYEDMTEAQKKLVGPLPDGYLAFWTMRFPTLLLTCWNVVYEVGWEETDRFKDYYEPAGL